MGRGRPRVNPSASGLDPADEIIDTAIRLIKDGGINAMTASTLARELKVARTVIYHHFDDADGVIASVGARVMSPLFHEMARLNESQLGPSEKLRSYINTETRLLATTPVPVEAILTSPSLHKPAHAGLWESLDELQNTTVDWLVSATGVPSDEANTRLAAASSMTLGMRILHRGALDENLDRLVDIQLGVLGLSRHRR